MSTYVLSSHHYWALSLLYLENDTRVLVSNSNIYFKVISYVHIFYITTENNVKRLKCNTR